MQEETLDELISAEAVKRGWADNKIEYVNRVLKYVLAEIEEYDAMRLHFTNVIKYLEAYKFDD